MRRGECVCVQEKDTSPGLQVHLDAMGAAPQRGEAKRNGKSPPWSPKRGPCSRLLEPRRRLLVRRFALRNLVLQRLRLRRQVHRGLLRSRDLLRQSLDLPLAGRPVLGKGFALLLLVLELLPAVRNVRPGLLEGLFGVL